MATLIIIVPDALVPIALAAMKNEYRDIDVDGLPAGAAARTIILTLVRRAVRNHLVSQAMTDNSNLYRQAYMAALASAEDAAGRIG